MKPPEERHPGLDPGSMNTGPLDFSPDFAVMDSRFRGNDGERR